MGIYVGNKRYAPYIGDKRREVRNKKALPYDAEVEYLESTGTQYIDTNIISQNNLVYDFYLVETVSNDQKRFFGFKEGSWLSAGMNDCNWGSNWFYVDFAGEEKAISNFGYNNRKNGGTYHLDFTNGNAKFTYNNTSKWTSTKTGTYNGTRHVYIFAIDYTSDQSSNRGIGRISYFQIRKTNVLLFDGIPVRVGQVGYMYDRVSGQLFGNAGTGDFILGNDKN